VTGRGSASRSTAPRLRVAAALGMAALSSAGCSFLFMSRPPEPVVTPNYPVECTSSRAAPVLDTICAAYHGVAGIAILATPACSQEPEDVCIYDAGDKAAVAAVMLGAAALCTASAVSGFRSAGRCREVKGLNALCITGDLAACRALRPGFVPPGPPGSDPWGTRPPDRWGPPEPAPQAPPARPQ